MTGSTVESGSALNMSLDTTDLFKTKDRLIKLAYLVSFVSLAIFVILLFVKGVRLSSVPFLGFSILSFLAARWYSSSRDKDAEKMGITLTKHMRYRLSDLKADMSYAWTSLKRRCSKLPSCGGNSSSHSASVSAIQDE